jgi:DNA repair exonuclease SbcCD ATPase subunit
MPFSPEDIAQLVEALTPVIVEKASQAAADHVTKRNKKIEKLEAKIDSFTTSTKDEEEPESVAKTNKERIAQSENEIKRLRDELKAEKLAAQHKSMRANLEEKLRSNGIPPHLIKAVSAQLIYEDKLVDLDSSGSPVFKSAEYGDQVPLEEGLSEWFKQEGKTFVAAPQVNGAKQRPIKTAAPLKQAIQSASTVDEADAVLIEALRNSR